MGGVVLLLHGVRISHGFAYPVLHLRAVHLERLLGFWIAGAIFFAWYIIMLVQLFKVYRRDRAEEGGQLNHPESRSHDSTGAVDGTPKAAAR